MQVGLRDTARVRGAATHQFCYILSALLRILKRMPLSCQAPNFQICIHLGGFAVRMGGCG